MQVTRTLQNGVLNSTPLVLHNIDTKIGVNFNTNGVKFSSVGVGYNTNGVKCNINGVKFNTNFGIYIVQHLGC